MTDITTDLAAIGAALDAGPTPGEWHRRGTLGPMSAQHLQGPYVIERQDGNSLAHMTGWRTDQQSADAAYIAACHPARIGRLLADHARLTAERDRLAAEAARWQTLYRRAVNEANGLTNYVEDRPDLRSAERRLSAIESEARAAIVTKET